MEDMAHRRRNTPAVWCHTHVGRCRGLDTGRRNRSTEGILAMFRAKPCLWILLVVTLLSGQAPPTDIPPAKQPTTQSAGNAPETLAAEEASTLCLADPLGAASLDTELRAYQRQVHSLPQKADMWV